jgi:hypothetical protein
VNGADSTSGLASPESLSGGFEPAGRETADGGALESPELDAPRQEPWWSQLAALMQDGGGSQSR